MVFGLLIAGATAQSRPSLVADASGSRPAAASAASTPIGVYRPFVRVVDAQGRPVPRATVFAGDPDTDGGFTTKKVWFPSFETDDAGRVAIPTGSGVAVQAEAAGYATAGGLFAFSDDAGQELELRLAPLEVVSKDHATRDGGMTGPQFGLRLKVLDPRGSIASNASVRMSPTLTSAAIINRSAFAAADRAAISARTDDAGQFSVAKRRPGVLGVGVRLPGVGIGACAAPLSAAGDLGLLRLSPERRVTISAVDGSGRPAEGVLIAATNADGVVYPAGAEGDIYIPDDATPSFAYAATESITAIEPIPFGASEVRLALPATGRVRVSSYVPLAALRPGRKLVVDDAIRGVVSDAGFPHLQSFTLPPGVWRFVPLSHVDAESRIAARFPFVAEHRRLGFSAVVVPGGDVVLP